MKVGDLVKVDYGDERGFGPPCILLSFKPRRTHSFRDPEWVVLMDQTGRRFDSQVDYIYPVR